CPIISVSGGRNSAPLLVSVGGGIVPHHWCQCGWNSAPSLVSVGRRNSAPSLASVGGGIVPHRWRQLGEE
ncbi:unnamed protein product, partial [Staurois parvus]